MLKVVERVRNVINGTLRGYAKNVTLRNATLNFVKLRYITLKVDASNGNVNDAKYTKAPKVVKPRYNALTSAKLHWNIAQAI